MDINEYISSGIIENYILGNVSPQEKQEVECMSSIYPEVKTELEQLQIAIENVAFALEKKPPTHLKSKIFAIIEKEKQDVENWEEIPKVPTIVHKTNSSNPWKYLAAASIIIAVVFASLFYLTNNDLTLANWKLNNLISEIDENKTIYENKLIKYSEKIKERKELIAFLQHYATKKVILKGTKLQPNSICIVYFNEESSKVFLDATPKMEKIPKNKQYQLWAIVDGKPSDMGVLPHNISCKYLCPMPNVSNAQAFAITVEKAGGSLTPSLDKLAVMGNV